MEGGLMSHLELLWEDHETADFYCRLAELGRLIMFDKRDTGLSDRPSADMPLEERMEDVRAVMRAAGSSQAALFGYSEGAPMSILFAATYPARVSALILGSASARWFPAPGYPCGQGAQQMYDALVDIATHRWGQGASIEWYLQSRAGSARARQLFGRFERMSISPSAFLRMARMIRVLATIMHAQAVGPRPVQPDACDAVRGHRGRLIRTTSDGRSPTGSRRSRGPRRSWSRGPSRISSPDRAFPSPPAAATR
jgi:pimeloyl-ACP methyl ester carboxylesterase